MVTAIQSPAGDHSAWVTGSSPLVTMRGNPPSDGTIHACGDPLMFEMKLTHLPSGEKLGLPALPTRAMRATAAATSLALGGVFPASLPLCGWACAACHAVPPTAKATQSNNPGIRLIQ